MMVPATVEQPATHKPWLHYAVATVVLWGIWGAFADLPAERGFPETLVYCVWSLTMIPPAAYAIARIGWRLDREARSIFYGLLIGFLGAGGQMLLFYALRTGPAYLVFPLISLSPVITIALCFLLLGERTNALGAAGIMLALLALPLFDFSPQRAPGHTGVGWFVLSLIIMAAWGLQAVFLRTANRHMSAESIFFYMTLSGLLLGPLAWAMTDFGRPVNWGLDGLYLAAVTQLMNAIGALTLVHAFRYGQAIIVSPLINAGAPLLTAAISLAVAGTLPGRLKLVALLLASVAAVLLALAPEEQASAERNTKPIAS